MSDLLFDSWDRVARVVIVAVAGYAGLLTMLRISGKRSNSKLNMFDWIVTVALGSTLASLILSSQTPLVNGLAAFATLIGLQFAVSWSGVRSQRINDFVRGSPTLVYYDGHYLEDRMRRERIVEEEIRAAIRREGLGSMDHVKAVILETTGELAIVRQDVRLEPDEPIFRDVGFPEPGEETVEDDSGGE